MNGVQRVDRHEAHRESTVGCTGCPAKKVAIVTLGCARKQKSTLRSWRGGCRSVACWDLVENARSADAVLVNTCGFIEAAKRESIDTVLSLAGDDAPAVIATGCLAERYGTELAASLPEARAVLGFDDYRRSRRDSMRMMREDVPAPIPTDRRTLLPLSPVARSDARLDASAGARDDQQASRTATDRRYPAFVWARDRWPRSNWQVAATEGVPFVRSRAFAALSSRARRRRSSPKWERWLPPECAK